MRAFDPTRIPPIKSAVPAWLPGFDSKPVDLELGAGAGLHAIRYSKENPGRAIIAIERTSKADRMLSRAANHPELKNLIAVRADAIHWIALNVPPESIERCFILYPNPYPKSRQKNLRWHNMPFMGFLKSRLKRDGKIITATNEDFYAQEATEQMPQWGFKVIEDQIIDPARPPRTHFEKKYLARGFRCRNLIFEKAAHSET